jgi:hypothetical protein
VKPRFEHEEEHVQRRFRRRTTRLQAHGQGKTRREPSGPLGEFSLECLKLGVCRPGRMARSWTADYIPEKENGQDGKDYLISLWNLAIVSEGESKRYLLTVQRGS